MRTHVVLYLNGKRLELGPGHARMMLADFLRAEAGLTGTKIVCAEGDCGACTVLRSFAGFGGKLGSFNAINSCIVTVGQMDGSSLVTVDALADGDRLTPVQASMVKCHGSQCGFCTPGFVMALTGLVEKKLANGSLRGDGRIDEREAKNALTGNLCRCTGYQQIIDAAKAIPIKDCDSVAARFASRAQAKDLREAIAEPLLIEDEGYRFFAPTSLKQAAAWLKKNPQSRLLGAATDLGVVHNKWRQRLVDVVSLHLVPELYALSMKSGRVRVGARVSLSELREKMKEPIPEFARFLDLFASPQIKNIATLIGNVANASPIADTPPFLLVAEAEVEIVGSRGSRRVPIEEFFVDYRKTALKPGEMIVAISFDAPKRGEFLSLRKVSERKDLDISAVNAAIRLSWEPMKGGRKRVADMRLAIGGVAATTLRLRKAEAWVRGRDLAAESLDPLIEAVHAEISPIDDARGSAAFRRVLVENLVRRFFAEATA